MKRIYHAALLLTMTLFICTSTPAMAQDVIDDFVFDGCSAVPEGTPCDTNQWCDCCLTHDKAYWKGGSWTDRRNADLDFKDCVTDRSGSAALGLLYYLGVRAGGSPFVNTPFRWGYGWDYGRGYQGLTSQENAIAEDKWDTYIDDNPDPCSDF